MFQKDLLYHPCNFTYITSVSCCQCEITHFQQWHWFHHYSGSVLFTLKSESVYCLCKTCPHIKGKQDLDFSFTSLSYMQETITGFFIISHTDPCVPHMMVKACHYLEHQHIQTDFAFPVLVSSSKEWQGEVAYGGWCAAVVSVWVAKLASWILRDKSWRRNSWNCSLTKYSNTWSYSTCHSQDIVLSSFGKFESKIKKN